MSTRINTNTTAFEAARNLSVNSDNLSKNIQRLSSGLRINSAADDASGLVISESLQAQSAGLTQATKNTNDAINVVKTAEGALNEVQSLLIKVRQTILHAANVGANDSTALQADATSVNQAISSIDRIANTTQFNNKNLLDGSASIAGSVTAGTATASSTGTGFSVANQASTYASSFSGQAVAFAVATATTAAGTNANTTNANFQGSLSINGTAYTVGTTGSTTGAVSLSALNTAISASGYTATTTGGQLSLTSTATGKPASAATFSFTGLSSYASADATGTASAFTNGATVQGKDAGLTLNGVAATSSTTTNGTTTSTFANGLQLSTTATTAGSLGTLAATADVTKAGSALQFQIGSNQNQTVSVTVGSQKSNAIGAYTDTTTSTSYKLSDLLAGGGLNLTDVTGKSQQNALAVVDQAIKDISTTREQLGSVQSNELQSNLNSLGVAQQNTDSSLSTIRDTDLSAEIVNYTKNQILVQAGTSALAQANQAPQAILKLLQ